jgi:peptidoglycan/xylan/chitin deacetylase (PgdA/CDA1 family)
VTAHYLLRFDDICPTMNWSVWSRVEAILDEHGVLPIIAVVPDNQDSKLKVDAPRADFWAWVREKQARGWCIALHGYQHLYETADSGLLGINTRSEFAGLAADAQRNKLIRALEIFRTNGVKADAWIAPGHSFDATTVRLLVELGVDTISDGFFLRPVRHLDAYWIPQQFWHYRPMPSGLWTVCLHTNAYLDVEIDRLRNWLKVYGTRTISVAEIKRRYPARAPSFADRAFEVLIQVTRAIRRRFPKQ